LQINLGSKAISCKIVYYGPGLSGKTTNIEMIHGHMPESRRGELTSIKTKGDRTLFFDFMAVDLGKVAGMDTRFQIYTVPGQVYYNATRKLVLQGADGIIFVADSAPDRMQANIESWQNLQDNLAERGLSIRDLPVVIQCNKRDLSGAVATEEMNGQINTIGAPVFEAVACRGEGVLQTLKAVCGLVCRSVNASQAGRRTVVAAASKKAAEPVASAESAAGAKSERFASRWMPRPAAGSGVPATAMAVREAKDVAEDGESGEVVASVASASQGTSAAPEPWRRERRTTAAGAARRSSSVPVGLIIVVATLAAAAAAVLYALGIW